MFRDAFWIWERCNMSEGFENDTHHIVEIYSARYKT